MTRPPPHILKRFGNQNAAHFRKRFMRRIPVPLRKPFHERFVLHLGRNYIKNFLMFTRIYFMKHFSYRKNKRSQKQITSHFMKRIIQRLSKHFIIFASTISLIACSDDNGLPACPHGMHRNTLMVCTPDNTGGYPPGGGPDDPSNPGDPSPGEGPEAPPPRCPEDPASAAIHEALIDPEGPDKGQEWIELRVDQDGALDGSYLDIRHSYLDPPHHTIRLAGRVRVGDLVVTADALPDTTPFGCALTHGCLRNSGGIIELRGCDHGLLDTLAWGTATPDRLPVRSGFTLSWCPYTQRWANTVPTPGAPEKRWRNDAECLLPCAPPPFLVINEVLYDLVGADGGGEFIELLTTPNTALDGLRLHGINGANGRPLFGAIALRGESDDEGYFVIGGDEIVARAMTLPTALQNGPEALWVEGCDGTLLDTMTYGGWTEHLAPYGDASPLLPEGQSLGRSPDGAQSTGTMADFAGMSPTPGAPNGPPLDANGDEAAP